MSSKGAPASKRARRGRKPLDDAGWEALEYHSGYGSHVSTEAVPGTLPVGQNSPQKCIHGLFAEQLSGTAFTCPRATNRRTWAYRLSPSVRQGGYSEPKKSALSADFSVIDPSPRRWSPMPLAAPVSKTDWLDGMQTMCGAGEPLVKDGVAIHMYACNAPMADRAFCNADGEMLIVPQEGTLLITTEMGKMEVPSDFICVIPRGIKFSVAVPETGARGYICEVFNSSFELPPLGVIGANGLSNARDFQKPVAWYEDRDCSWTHYQTFNGELFQHSIGHSPFDVVAWHGTMAPYRYNLADFCVVNSVSFDHLDPSIFCVLTAQTAEPGVAVCDFVIFPPRFMVQEDTFRPPYYHRNVMSEFMGNIRGTYEAKTDGGFRPGGSTLHNTYAAHGPAADVFKKASTAELKPMAPNRDHQAFMFESYYTMKLTDYTVANHQDKDYIKCWANMPKTFDPSKK